MYPWFSVCDRHFPHPGMALLQKHQCSDLDGPLRFTYPGLPGVIVDNARVFGDFNQLSDARTTDCDACIGGLYVRLYLSVTFSIRGSTRARKAARKG